MNIVYKLTFKERLKNNTPPFYYIGSKTNCDFSDNKIYNKSGKVYYGSSKSKLFKEALLEEKPIAEILHECDDYNKLLLLEKDEQLLVNTKTSSEYFNLEYATMSTYSNPNYGTFRHKDIPGKFIRLPKDDELVKSGVYVNANSGYKTYNNGIIEKQFLEKPSDEWVLGRLEKHILRGKDNPFYSKTHSKETKKLLSEITKKQLESEEARKLLSETAKKTFTGRPKSEKQLANMKAAQSRICKDTRMLTNSITGESKRVHISKLHLYDETIWKNPYSLKPRKNFKWITNGIVSKTINENEELPENFWYGRTYKRK